MFFVQGAVVYAHFGQEDDFTILQNKNVNLTGRVVLLRAGRISYAEKVGGFNGKYDFNIIIYFHFFSP